MKTKAPPRIWLIICSIAALVLFAAYFRPLPPQPSLEELPRTLLVLTNGFLCRVGETNPFTGWMFETNVHGGIHSRSFLSNGLLEGLSEGYYTNGQLQVVEHFHAGVSHGHRTKWHSNGKMASKAVVVNGQLDGVFFRWSDDGYLTEEIPMKLGEPHGLSRSYYPSGSIKSEARLNNGQIINQESFAEGQREASKASIRREE